MNDTACSGASTPAAVATTSAVAAFGPMTLIDAVSSTGHPVVGSITWPYQRSPKRNPRLARPLVATAAFDTAMVVSGGSLS